VRKSGLHSVSWCLLEEFQPSDIPTSGPAARWRFPPHYPSAANEVPQMGKDKKDMVRRGGLLLRTLIAAQCSVHHMRACHHMVGANE
jgi:hypothetical protein